MDKQTLSHYGWIVVMVLTLSVMLAFATPLGKYIGMGASNILIGFVGANDEAVDENKVREMGDYWEDYLGQPGEQVEINEHGFSYGVFYVAPVVEDDFEYLTGFTLLEDGTIIFVNSYYGFDGVRVDHQFLANGFDIENDLFYCGSDTYSINAQGNVVLPYSGEITFKNNGATAIVTDGEYTMEFNWQNPVKPYVPFETGKKYQYIVAAEYEGIMYEEYFTLNSDYTGEMYNTEYGISPITSFTVRSSGFTVINLDAPSPYAPSMMYIMYCVTGYWYGGVVG